MGFHGSEAALSCSSQTGITITSQLGFATLMCIEKNMSWYLKSLISLLFNFEQELQNSNLIVTCLSNLTPGWSYWAQWNYFMNKYLDVAYQLYLPTFVKVPQCRSVSYYNTNITQWPGEITVCNSTICYCSVGREGKGESSHQEFINLEQPRSYFHVRLWQCKIRWGWYFIITKFTLTLSQLISLNSLCN